MKKNFLRCLVIIYAILTFTSPAWSWSTSVGVGDTFGIDIIMDGFTESNLAAFDFNINYNPNILSFNSYVLGTALGDISLSDAEDWSKGNFANGVINIAEFSWISDFSFQEDKFTLVSLIFTGIGEGVSPISFSDISFSDEYGNLIPITFENGSIEVVTPEPATMLLLGIGLIGVAGLKRKFGK